MLYTFYCISIIFLEKYTFFNKNIDYEKALNFNLLLGTEYMLRSTALKKKEYTSLKYSDYLFYRPSK